MTGPPEKECWVCAGNTVRPTVKYNDWQIYHCGECGFRFAEDGKPLVYDDHYDEEYFAPLIKRDQMNKWSAIYSERLTWLQQNAPAKTLLEAGAGASTFALHAGDYGFDVNVVDAAPWAVDFLTSHEGVSGRVADLNDCTLPAQTYGAIHCSHVLEHLSNPRGFLNQCYNSLQEDGLMYLSFPAYQDRTLAWRDRLHRAGLANHPYNYGAPDHLSYFSTDCIRNTVTEIGFEIVRLRKMKFISLYDTLDRVAVSGILRRSVGTAVRLAAPITRRIGIHRDLELILRRPRLKSAQAA